jgi:uncharacterized protein (TIGR03000 family)
MVRFRILIPLALAAHSSVQAQAPRPRPYPPPPSTRGPLVSPPGWMGPGPAPVRPPYRGYPGPGPWAYQGLPGGPWVGGPWWVPPSYSGSFWTNGLTLYGPPVPTYAPVPGAFKAGDADKTFFTNPPPASAIFVGLGWGGYRTPSPRPSYPSVRVWPEPPAGNVIFAEPAVATPPPDATRIRLTVRLPDAAAEVWIEQTAMKGDGPERVFDSPPLQAGKTYRYELVANWKENGESKAESRTVTAVPGEGKVIDFTQSRQ